MLDYRIAFERPEYLLLLSVLPVLWWLGRRSLAGLGPWRRWTALVLRTLLVLLIVAALAEIQWVRTSDRMAVLYLVDRSQSVPAETADAAIDFIKRSAEKHQQAGREDRSGVIVFGREAAVESPPLAGSTHLADRFETQVDGAATNLAAALRLAQAVFPADAAKRVVVISDGNQNAGDAQVQAQQLAAAGIGIDVLPIELGGQREVAVEKIVLPQDIRQGTPFEARVVLDGSSADPKAAPTSGRLVISRTAGGQTQVLADQPVEVGQGKQVLSFKEEIAAPDFYTYSARFVPDDAAGDTLAENNEATSFTHVRGRGQVLLIEDFAKPGQFAELVALLQRQELEVVVQPSNRLFTSLAELQRYDLVVLADVARTTGSESDALAQFSDEQIEMLVHNTQHMGSGLLMLGGPDSFGAGGWTNSALEKAMPVDFQVKNAKVVPSGALMLVLDRSGSMSGEKLELSKAAAMAAVKVLGRDDYVGVVAFDSAAHWIVPVTKINDPENILRRIARLNSGGGTDMEPGMAQGYRALSQVNAAIKHMIVLTDGQTHGANFIQMAQHGREQKITTTTVAIGRDAASGLLNSIARAGGGKYYLVDNPSTIPRIFMKEAMRVSRPVIYEDAAGIQPQRVANHEILDGVDGIPPMTGFVMTSPKDSPLVEIPLLSPKPTANRNALLATWQYGLGRSVAFTTDAGQRWTKSWHEWPGYEKLLTQMARWTMRPTDKEGALNVFAEARDGAIEVVVTALDKDDQFVNFLDLGSTIIDPEMKRIDLPLKQTAPGRYVGRLPAAATGSYFLSVAGGPNQAPVRAGINVPYSAEFKDRKTNEAMLRNLAALTPAGGAPGLVLGESPDGKQPADLLAADVFRHDLRRATTRQDGWHLVAFLAGCLFLLDVFNRRVIVSFDWLPALAERIRAKLPWGEPAAQPAPAIDRLQSRKRQATEQWNDRRAAARYEPETLPAETLAADAVAVATQAALAPQPETSLAPQAEEEDYTARLLKAKQRALKGRKP